jgi:type IV pilus assembly protein PilW
MNLTHFSAGGRTLRGRSLGLSLVELMVAVTLGLIVMLALGEVYLSSSRTYRSQEALSRIQENARFALETLSYDIRMAGQVGCSYDSTLSVNVLNSTSYGNLLGEPLRGIAAAGAIPSPFTATPSTGDAIRIFRSDENEIPIQSHVPGTSTFTFAESTVIPTTLPSGFSKGDILIVTDCDTAAIFQASDPVVAGTTVVHAAGAGAPTGNCVANLGPKPVAAGACATATSKTFPAGSKVTKLLGNLYYIAANPAGEPALYRQRLVKGAPVTEELIEGVEDMRISYGIDTSGDGSVDSTVTAASVANWDQVQTVQISLLLRSDNNALDQPQTYTFDGAETTPADRRIRKVFNATIAVRSRQ